MLRVLLLLPLLAPFASAQEEGRTELTLLAHADRQFYWTLEGSDERNPALVVPPGARVTVTVRNVDDDVHNLVVEGFPRSGYVNDAGDEVVYEFTAPESGTLGYWCEPHRAAGMRGVVRVAGTPDEPTREQPAPGAWPALAAAGAAALLLRRRAR